MANLKGCGRKLGPYDCCTVVCGDCLELMKALPDGCVDAVITDIPYNASQKSHGLRRLNYGAWDKDFDAIDFFRVMVRLPRGTIYIWCGDTQLSPLISELRSAGFLDRSCAWVKRNPTVINGDRLWLPAIEFCAFGKRPASFFNAPCQSPVWWDSPDVPRLHPNQKPELITAAQVSASVPDGGSILDPFLGSGTTAVAAKKLGRHFLGFEINPDYCKIAEERIALMEAQPNLFEPKPDQLEFVGASGN
jgi:site-specific DNA-methyltransferase (adenine-specific)